MKRIVYAWELGGGFGHLDRIFALGSQLAPQDIEIIYSLRDLPRAELRASAGQKRFIQSPMHTHRGGELAAASNYADILLRCGYEDPVELTGLLRGWINLYELTKPDLILTDHAPTAALAARHLKIPACSICTGFEVPPVHSKITPSIQPWNTKLTRQQLRQKDQQALSNINQALAACSAAPINKVMDIYDIKQNYLCTFPELDHFEDRQNATYAGPMFRSHGNTFEAWEKSSLPRLFIYVSAAHPQFQSLINSLRTLPYASLVYTRDLKMKNRQPTIDGNLFISPQPLALDSVLQHADLIISNGGSFVTAATLLRGTRLLILPQHMEQALLGYKLAFRNLAIMVNSQKSSLDWADIIEKVRNSDSLQQALKQFRQRYRHYDPEKSLHHLAISIKKLL